MCVCLFFFSVFCRSNSCVIIVVCDCKVIECSVEFVRDCFCRKCCCCVFACFVKGEACEFIEVECVLGVCVCKSESECSAGVCLGGVVVCEEFPRECFAVFCLEFKCIVWCVGKCMRANVDAVQVHACVLEGVANDVGHKITCGVLSDEVRNNVLWVFSCKALVDAFGNVRIKGGCFLEVD